MTRNQAILVTFILAGMVAILLVRRLLSRPDEITERLEVYASLPEFTPGQSVSPFRRWLARLRVRVNATLSVFTTDEMTIQLMSANWAITPVEYLIIRLAITGIGFVLGWLFTNSPVGGLAAAVFVYILPGFLLERSINRRRIQFERQLVDVMVLTTGAVRAGFSLLQAMEVVVRELRPPASEEFRRVLREVGLGRTLNQSLVDLAARMENKDLSLLITAINIQYKVGGNLVLMLESVTETIRERIRLFGEVRVLTTQQRFSSYILCSLPFIVGILLFMINPRYMMNLFNPNYIFLPVMALLGIVMGFIIIRRLARINI